MSLTQLFFSFCFQKSVEEAEKLAMKYKWNSDIKVRSTSCMNLERSVKGLNGPTGFSRPRRYHAKRRWPRPKAQLTPSSLPHLFLSS